MTTRISRRQALLGASSVLLVPAACTITATRDTADVFVHGVASGDPDATSVVLWTRISGFNSSVIVDWRIASDADFRNIVADGDFRTHAGRDYTVNVVADNLKSGTEYFYQFSVGTTLSSLGQTKTLPVGHVDKLAIAVATCSNYPFGFFNAYEDIANDEDIDLVVHLGDYIYEYDKNGYGGDAGKKIGRVHKPEHEIITLSDYRERHAQYKSDAGSRAMHGRHPLVVIWDDHETANNPWMGGAQNHQADEGDWQERRSASMTAYYEWMPIRAPEAGTPRENYWRHFKFGDLLSLVTLESRHTGRSLQIDYGDLSRFNSPSEAQHFFSTVVGAPDRNFLSIEMETFLSSELRDSVESGIRWRLIGNQSILAKMIAPKLNAPAFDKLRNSADDSTLNTLNNRAQVGALDLTDDLDSWSGYPAARERFYQTAKSAGANDLLVISGDSHSFWANTLRNDRGENMGLELGSTGITSPSSLLALGIEGAAAFDQLNQAQNPDIVWTDSLNRGYIKLEINQREVKADFIAVSNVASRDYESRVIHTERIASANGQLHYI